jgi:hypothetical protein
MKGIVGAWTDELIPTMNITLIIDENIKADTARLSTVG